MKLVAIYTVFNGIEHLELSMKQVLPYVDMVLISYQTISNRGEHRPELKEQLIAISKKHKNVFLLPYSPNMAINTKENERRKLNQAIQYCIGGGFTHFVLLATDHYYMPDEFIKAKVKAEKYDVTLTKMYTYYKKATWQLTPIEDYCMPFICKLHPHTEVSKEEYKGYRTDPSVRINTRDSIYCFEQHEIMLHHYSMVRIDVMDKFKNAAAGIRWTEEQRQEYQNEYLNYNPFENPGIKYFGGRKIKIIPDHFGVQECIDAAMNAGKIQSNAPHDPGTI